MPAPKTYPETVSHREFFRFAAHSEWQVFHEATMRALVAQLAAESEYWTQPEWGEKFATPAASSFIPALSDETRPNARDKIATWWRIGHKEVWKVLKCLSANRRKDATCGKCKFREICPSSSEGETFAKIYARLIHIRILRDYREDVFFDRVTRDYLADAFFRMSMKALMLADKYLSHSLGGFLRTPVHLELTLEKIRSMHPHAPQIEAPT